LIDEQGFVAAVRSTGESRHKYNSAEHGRSLD
jgi:hypothetical protein